MEAKTHWSPNQVKMFAAQIKTAWGGLWPHVSVEVRTALVDAHVTTILSCQDAPTFSVVALDELRDGLHQAMQTGLYAP